MREIKFRAWDKSDNKYYKDIQSFYDGTPYHLFPKGDDCFGGILEDDNFIVEQFTGLRDKNGKEIYEGDQIKIDYGVFTVVWRKGCFLLDDYDNGDYYEGTNPLITKWDESEIVGNIHENPELLDSLA